MPAIKLDIDAETYARLTEQAVAEKRPIDWQAEVALRRAFGLPFPVEVTTLTKNAGDGPAAA